MTIQTKAYLKSRYARGAKPTQQDFIDLIDSYEDNGGSSTTTPIGAALITASSQASARSAIGVDFVTTAQAITGALSTGGINPVLMRNAIETVSSAQASIAIAAKYATTAAAVSGQASTGIMNPVLVRNAIDGYYATTAAAVSGQAATGLMNPVLVRNAIAASGSQKFVTSAVAVVASAASYTISHNLGSTPYFISPYLRNINPEFGFVAGEETLINPSDQIAGGGTGQYGMQITPNSSTVNIRLAGLGFIIFNKSTGGVASITPSNWELFLAMRT